MVRTLTFHAVDVGDGGQAWAARARADWRRVFGLVAPESLTDEGAAAALATFRRHMPELVPVLERLADSLDHPYGAAVLTHTIFKPIFTGCSQTVIDGALVRNYDLHPDESPEAIHRSHFLRPVIGMAEGLWGLLDGMNDAGLAVSLTFGGRPVHGPGFACPLVVRHLLETCATAAEAWDRLRDLPVVHPQNLTLVDRNEAMTVHVGPDREATRAEETCTTNHQDRPVPAEQERITRTGERLVALRRTAAAEDFLRPPLYQTDYDGWLGTLYTAAYRPAEGRVTYLWPGERWEQSFASFSPGVRSVRVGEYG
ncbi:C45 family autoproteolytic acyltransferase/hydolase [Streptosporangium carneum]|uniref:Peptidase C45 n=1 Tax=Streptosporangium carneum TaxID=47481 RepID=A0A9W6MF63_9ACTN|nr:C45 family peptidase [Streptosporangium carneum]GLK11921.1 peptidase C45 [Streptosporangium carneum]